MDCDGNLDGPSGFLGKPPFAWCPIRFTDDGKPVELEQCFDRLIQELIFVAKQDHIKTVIIDSLTMVNEFVIRKILSQQARPFGEMEARDWIPFKSKFLTLLVRILRGMNKTTICAVHEVILTKSDPKNMMNVIIEGYRPSVQGSVTDYFGAFFTDVWRCTSSPPIGGKPQPYQVQTVKDSRSPDLKSSCGMPGEMKAEWAEVNKYLKL